jgi:hypothetical protein
VDLRAIAAEKVWSNFFEKNAGMGLQVMLGIGYMLTTELVLSFLGRQAK